MRVDLTRERLCSTEPAFSHPRRRRARPPHDRSSERGSTAGSPPGHVSDRLQCIVRGLANPGRVLYQERYVMVKVVHSTVRMPPGVGKIRSVKVSKPL